MIAGICHRLHQLVDDVLRGGDVGIAHAQVDDVFTPPSGLTLQGVNNAENIRGKSFDPAEFFHHV